MGIYNGSVAFMRYRLLGQAKPQTLSRLDNLLEPYKSPALKLDSTARSEAIGWVRPLVSVDSEVIDSDLNWSMSDCQTAGGLLLRVRYERRKVSPSLLQMVYRQKLSARSKSTAKPLSRIEMRELKDEVATDLMRRTLPTIQFTDVLWREAAQELLIFNTSRKVNERVIQLFNQTFGDDLDLTLIKLDTATAWIEAENSEARFESLTKTKPSVFSRQVI